MIPPGRRAEPAALLLIVALLGLPVCTNEERSLPPPPQEHAAAWPCDARAKAEEHLRQTPRTTIAGLGGDHTQKIVPLEGETRDPVLEEVFPDHRFFRFRWLLFSGRQDPNMYVAVSRTGAVQELMVFVDYFDVCPSVVEFFQANAGTAKTPEAATKVMRAYAVLRGRSGSEVQVEKTESGALRASDDGLRMEFDPTGKLVRFAAQ